MGRWLSALVLGVAATSTPQSARPTSEPKPLAPGAEAPSFELVTLDGRKTTSAELRGDALDGKERNVVVLVFWAQNCPWVKGWNPALDALVKKYAAPAKVRFAVVDCDRNEVRDPKTIAKYLADSHLSFQVHLDLANKVADAFGATHTPHCFVVGRDGKVVYTGRIDDRDPFAEDAAVKAVTPPAGLPGAKVEPVPLLAKAIDAALAGKTPEVTIDPPKGCRIKRQ